MTKFWFDGGGVLLGSTSDEAESFPDAVDFTNDVPDSGAQIWDGLVWEFTLADTLARKKG